MLDLSERRIKINAGKLQRISQDASNEYVHEKKTVSLLLVLSVISALAVPLTGCDRQEQKDYITREDWADDVRTALNAFIAENGTDADDYDASTYAVFDFDNTISVFDVGEQLSVYQLQHMAFAAAPSELPGILSTGLGDPDVDLSELGYGNGSYNDWISDITAAYEKLYEKYGPFSAAGLSDQESEMIQADEDWQEFSVKMRTLYNVVYDNESASAAYPWVTYWFTGMTEQEIYDLAYHSHQYYSGVDTSEVTWSSPENYDSRVGQVTYTWTSGVQVTENMRELIQALHDSGIRVWICSASYIDVVRAAVDYWGLHDYVSGVLAMTNSVVDGKMVNRYDYETGCASETSENFGTSESPETSEAPEMSDNPEMADPPETSEGSEPAEDSLKWVKSEYPTCAQTQGEGKVTAIENTLCRMYGHGPAAGFMDSTGDFNFCTEFASLQLVVCFNRASRKITDGGGLIAELAVYQRDTLQYDLESANAAGDTFYVLQGRDENGKRTFRSSNSTLRFGADSEKLFANEDNELELQYMIDHRMSTAEILNTFSRRTAESDEENLLGIRYGFLTEYRGYHAIVR